MAFVAKHELESGFQKDSAIVLQRAVSSLGASSQGQQLDPFMLGLLKEVEAAREVGS